MKAVILAAGYGSRMYPLAQDMPKCLLTIKGETILARQLRMLRSCGIDDVTVVTGFHSEKIAKLYREEVSIRYNPHYEITGSIFSLWVARDILVDDVIIMVSDVVFVEESLRRLMANDSPYCMIVDDKPCDEEAQKVKVDGGVITEISKAIPPEETFGEFAYVAKVRKDSTNTFKESLFECVKRNSNLDWPNTFLDLQKRGYRINYILADSPWMEIDTEEDYKRSKKLYRRKE